MVIIPRYKISRLITFDTVKPFMALHLSLLKLIIIATRENILKPTSS